MKGLIGFGTFCGCLLGLLATAAHAAPEARIECTGEPRLEGVGDKGIEISTDVVGLVRVVGDLEAVEDEGEAEGDEAVMTAKAFCDAHEGVDTFILPAPRLVDEPRTPDGEEQLELERPGRPEAGTGQKSVDTPEADDGGDDSDEAQTQAMGMADLPDVAGQYKSFDPQMTTGSGCSQAAGQSQTGWWFALLPLLLMVRVRREGDR